MSKTASVVIALLLFITGVVLACLGVVALLPTLAEIMIPFWIGLFIVFEAFSALCIVGAIKVFISSL